jgi:HlyD family secretion protein
MHAALLLMHSRSAIETWISRKFAGQRSDSRKPVSDGVRSNLLLGIAVTILLVGGIGVWAAATPLAGAVIATGTVVVESSVKKVQHQDGGIVGDILVHEGDRVSAGDVLLRLDETLTRANLQIISQQYDRTLARQARLQAERVGLAKIKLPESLSSRLNDPQIAAVVSGEQALFESRTKALAGQKAQLRSGEDQLHKQIEGLTAQRKAAENSASLVDKDLNNLNTLFNKRLVSADRLSDKQLELSRLRGEVGRLAATIAEVEAKISETRLQNFQLDDEMRKDVDEELRDLDGKEAELAERKLVAKDQLGKTEIRAPQSGIVQELSVHTVGGVIAPGETIMLIVPATDGLVIDAKISPASIDDIEPGQPVSVRLSAFDATTTPECKGTVQRISADLISDKQSQLAYFLGRIVLDDKAACLRGTKRLLPGMPAEVHIQTGMRKVWSYVLKPLTDQISRAFKE